MIFDRIRRDEPTRALVALGLVEVWGQTGAGAAAELEQELDAEVARLRALHGGKTAGAIDALRPARQLYHALGIDPTRHRPSPEALLRRLLRGDEFPRVHPAVDLANLWAVVSGLPVGLYDADRIAGGPIDVRRGRPGESYAGIRKPQIDLAGALVIADAEGPFGNPSADSLRTAVADATAHFLYVLFAPVEIPIEVIDGWVAWLRERAAAYSGGRAISAVLP